MKWLLDWIEQWRDRRLVAHWQCEWERQKRRCELTDKWLRDRDNDDR